MHTRWSGHPCNYQTVKFCLLLGELNTPASMNILEYSHILNKISYLDVQRDNSIIDTIHVRYKHLLQTRNTSVKTNDDIDLHFLFLRIYQRVQWKVPRIFRLKGIIRFCHFPEKDEMTYNGFTFEGWHLVQVKNSKAIIDN